MVQHAPSQVFRLVTAGLVGVGLFAVLILIAGTGAVHAKLSDASDDISGFGFSQIGTNANDLLGYSWWVALFSLGVYVAIGYAVAVGSLWHRLPLLVPLTTAAFAMVCPLCHTAVVYSRANDEGALKTRASAWEAGAILLAILLLAMLLWLGYADCRSVETPTNVVNQEFPKPGAPQQQAMAPGHVPMQTMPGHNAPMPGHGQGHGNAAV